ncbi:MAG: hypothetical protein FJ320_06680 [SAR202 cluster bacterium]|nr:hypothetical protein [SAR202 cluster bacterium]
MEVKIKVKRSSPSSNGKAAWQVYTVDIEKDATVLDALARIREEMDPTLAFGGGCRTGMCGGCTMAINGDGRIACRYTVGKGLKGADEEGEDAISLAPIKMTTAVRDLRYDEELFHWSKLRAVEPWIEPKAAPAEGEHIMSATEAGALQEAMACTNCGLCDQGCVVIAVDKTYLGPAALAHGYRTVFDPRDSRTKERLEKLSLKKGIWDCAHCFEATEHCPRGVRPTHYIFDMHDKAMEHKAGPSYVRGHYGSFARSVKAHGWLDEGRLALETEGLTNVRGLLKLLPFALKAGAKGKRPMPYVLHPKRPGAEHIRRIFEKVEAKQKKEKGDEKGHG